MKSRWNEKVFIDEENRWFHVRLPIGEFSPKTDFTIKAMKIQLDLDLNTVERMAFFSFVCIWCKICDCVQTIVLFACERERRNSADSRSSECIAEEKERRMLEKQSVQEGCSFDVIRFSGMWLFYCDSFHLSSTGKCFASDKSNEPLLRLRIAKFIFDEIGSNKSFCSSRRSDWV